MKVELSNSLNDILTDWRYGLLLLSMRYFIDLKRFY